MPIEPGIWISPGIIPSLASPGVIIPGQLGPINLTPSSSTRFLTSSISNVGIPSVIQIINLMPASADSKIESLQNLAGTKIIEAFGSRELLASSTELKTGLPRCSIPPLPGVTPPTIFVPYSIDCSECNVPWEPVKPWTITLVSLLTKILILQVKLLF